MVNYKLINQALNKVTSKYPGAMCLPTLSSNPFVNAWSICCCRKLLKL